MKLWEQESHSLVQSRLSAAFPRVPLQLALQLIKAPADCTVPQSILWVFFNSIFFIYFFCSGSKKCHFFKVLVPSQPERWGSFSPQECACEAGFSLVNVKSSLRSSRDATVAVIHGPHATQHAAWPWGCAFSSIMGGIFPVMGSGDLPCSEGSMNLSGT